MKVFWSDRQGKAAPLEATFHYRPFSGSFSCFTSQLERVDVLPPPQSATVLCRSFLPEQSEWEKAVSSILQKKIEKVVLARCQVLELSEIPDPFALTALLQMKGEGAYTFCFSEGETAFFGISPERLFYRQKTALYSEAMAGTRARGQTIAEEARLGAELLSSLKDHREFTPVQEFLHRALLPFSPIFTPVSLYRTHNVQHLYTQCSARIPQEMSDREILDLIHPTPALCGTPQKKALELIRTLEPFDRGLYGGALGWSTEEASEYIVGIRSCFLQGKTAYLYAGTGIVEGSDPLAEWEELNQKTALYNQVFV